MNELCSAGWTQIGQDPRHKQSCQPQTSGMRQLTPDEIQQLVHYCDQMIGYARDKKSQRSWITLKKEARSQLSSRK